MTEQDKKKTRFRVLVLDHDDTTVNSTPEINYPAFQETLRSMRPEITYDYDTFLSLCFDPGFNSLCLDILKFDEDEMKRELETWLRYVRSTVPTAVPGIERVIRRQKEAGGVVCVVSHSMEENILRDWRTDFGIVPDAVYGWELGEERRKPSPWPLRDICRRFGADPSELIMIDDLKPGCDCARGAGVTFGAALWTRHTDGIEKYMKENADVCFMTTGELERYLFYEC